MKLLFLDIDGVLNTHQKMANGYRPIQFTKINLLNKLLDQFPDLQIVLSSSWRDHLKCVDAIEVFLCFHGLNCNDRVHGFTERDELTHDGPLPEFGDIKAWSKLALNLRANQILKYVDEHKPDKWVVLDDLPLSIDNLVKVNPRLGLIEDHIEKVVDTLVR